ncbi:MAG: hypothetical protein HYZ45_10645, partial [Burkholderiales bacterium]|nr:hypothetical protein [Burkholderiales bacterium]
EMLGGLGFKELDAKGVEAKLPGMFDATADLKGNGFYMNFLEGGKSRIWLNELSAANVHGQIDDDSHFSLVREADGSGDNRSLIIDGFLKDADGSISIQQLTALGIHYDNTDLGLHLNIGGAAIVGKGGSAIKYENQKDGSKLITLKQLRMLDAKFGVDDLLHMGKKKGPPKDSKKINEGFLNFLDKLNGIVVLTVHLTLLVDDHLLTRDTLTTRDFPLYLDIRNGKINYARLENHIFKNSAVFQQAIDFELKNGRLFIQLDLKTIGAAVGAVAGTAGGAVLGGTAGGLKAGPAGILPGAAVGAGIGGVAGTGAGLYYGNKKTKELVGWDLRKNDDGINEQELAENKEEVRIKTLVRDALPDGKPPAPPKPKDPSDPKVVVKDIGVDIYGINLSLKGGAVIDLADLNSEGLSGKINLGEPNMNAVEDFTVGGSILPASGPDVGKAKGKKTSAFRLGVGAVNLSVTDLKLEGAVKESAKRKGHFTQSSTIINTGAIHLGQLSDAGLTFGTGHEAGATEEDKQNNPIRNENIYPKTLYGTVTSGYANDVTIRLESYRIGKTTILNDKKKGKKK